MPHNPNESPEILLLAGAPWSGKSTLAQAVIELGSPRDIRHVSAGNLKRSIVAGKTPSRYAAELQSGKNVERKIGTDLGEFGTGIPDTLIPKTDLMTGIIEEFIDEHPDGLTIVDGFPR
jgi:adenylate kinase family enzyme